GHLKPKSIAEGAGGGFFANLLQSVPVLSAPVRRLRAPGRGLPGEIQWGLDNPCRARRPPCEAHRAGPSRAHENRERGGPPVRGRTALRSGPRDRNVCPATRD